MLGRLRGRREPLAEVAARDRDRAVRIHGRPFRFLGVVSGLAREEVRVRGALESTEPDAIALGVPEEDLEALGSLARGTPPEEDYEMSEAEELYAASLRRYGDIELPPADLVFAKGFADSRGIPAFGIDLATADYIDAFTRSVGAIELFRYSGRVRRLPRRLARIAGPEEFCLAWDDAVCRFPGIRAVERERERAMGFALGRIPTSSINVVVVLDLARVEGVVAAALASSGGGSGGSFLLESSVRLDAD